MYPLSESESSGPSGSGSGAESDGGNSSAEGERSPPEPVIPHEFEALYNDPELRQNLVDLIETANDLDILDFHEFCRNINSPKPTHYKTKATTGKHQSIEKSTHKKRNQNLHSVKR